ncbi:hypothetical protein CEXT_286091 [Caerostris extrusa]|uniref:Uncharacterized protein n=1 Tax=Caerostris extrusa TaxID=172846 RepID=A0AAV4SKK1_CAEEX|nr:hypothetical protein CEXT_286091 [Caerostris extrusa]
MACLIDSCKDLAARIAATADDGVMFLAIEATCFSIKHPWLVTLFCVDLLFCLLCVLYTVRYLPVPAVSVRQRESWTNSKLSAHPDRPVPAQLLSLPATGLHLGARSPEGWRPARRALLQRLPSTPISAPCQTIHPLPEGWSTTSGDLHLFHQISPRDC